MTIGKYVMTEKKTSAIIVRPASPELVKSAISVEATLIDGEPDYYCLNSTNQAIACNYAGWKTWHDSARRRKTLHGVKILDVVNKDYRISTSFLGHAHGYDDDQNPILWETVVLSKNGIDVQRYVSYNDAMRGHRAKTELINQLRQLGN